MASVTRDVTTPPKRNLVLRFMNGRGSQETIKDTLIMEKGGHHDSCQEENFSVFYATFHSVSERHSTL
jgi:hypothetical protein